MLNARRRTTAAQAILKLLSIAVLLSGIAETGIGLLLNFSTENAIKIVGETMTYALADVWWLICVSGVVSCLCGLAGCFFQRKRHQPGESPDGCLLHQAQCIRSDFRSRSVILE